MVEHLLSRLLMPMRKHLTERRLVDRGINVFEQGEKPKSGMILVTHPTVEDSLITRSVMPEAFSMVTARELEATNYEWINRFRAIVVAAMVPVYTDSKEKRMITYRTGAKVLDAGKLLTLAPTGKTTFSEKLPGPDEFVFGGMIKTLRHSKNNNRFVTPAVRHVHQKDINDDGTIASGSNVRMIYGSPVEVPEVIFSADKVPADELEKFAVKVHNSWRDALAQAGLNK